MFALTLLFACVALAAGQTRERVHVVNACPSETMWIASQNVPGPPVRKLDPGERLSYTIPDGLSATRFWPKMFCNSEGQSCKLGGSGGPGQDDCTGIGCGPAINSKFEATFGKQGGSCPSDVTQCDFFDTSGVDGYTVPYTVEVSEHCKRDTFKGVDIDCSKLRLSDCPVEDIAGVGSKNLSVYFPGTDHVVGCYSPCSLLTSMQWNNQDGIHTPQSDTANPYCCPTPPVDPLQCRAGPANTSAYTKVIHAGCKNVYAYAYDDSVGLQLCPPNTIYTWTLFCPTGLVKALSEIPRALPAGECRVGDRVQCSALNVEGQTVWCEGDECCPDGSICPSARAGFSSCPKRKNPDCSGWETPDDSVARIIYA